MRKIKKVSLIVTMISIGLIGSGMFLEIKSNDEKTPVIVTPDIPITPQKTITIEELLAQIPNTMEYKILNQNSEIAYEKAGDTIIFTDKKIDISYEVKINSNKLNIPYDDTNAFLNSIYYILLEAINLAYNNEIDLSYYLIVRDDYLYSKIGVEKIELEDGNHELVLDFSKEYKLPEDLTYISEENIKYYGYDKKLKTRDSFMMRIPGIRVLKSSYDSKKIKIDIISSKDDQINTYKSVLSFSKLLLTPEEYQKFTSDYDSLKSTIDNNLEIIVDYTLTENEKISLNENEQIIRIYYAPEEFK